MKKVSGRERELLIDGTFRGIALALCVVSLTDLMRGPDMIGLVWLGLAAVSIGMSSLVGWLWDIGH